LVVAISSLAFLIAVSSAVLASATALFAAFFLSFASALAFSALALSSLALALAFLASAASSSAFLASAAAVSVSALALSSAALALVFSASALAWASWTAFSAPVFALDAASFAFCSPASASPAALSAASLSALALSSVSVLQVMKQGNVVFIFVGSLALGLEKANKPSAALIMLILCGVLTCVLGGPIPSLIGIAFQLGSQFCEVGKVLMQSSLMSSKGHRLDPLSMVLFLAPVSAVIACIIFLGRNYDSLRIVHASFLNAWPWLLINSFAAFSLNVVVAWTIWMFNPTGFLIAGVVKDVSIVLAASVVFGEQLSRLQCAGFSVALIGISLYGSYKIRRGAQSKGPQARHSLSTGTKAEKQPLLKHETP